jgi:hypothetical protein
MDDIAKIINTDNTNNSKEIKIKIRLLRVANIPKLPIINREKDKTR